MTVQADLNVSKCLVSNSAWGENVITNVCNGVVTRVPWQFGDYVEAVLLGVLLAFVVMALIAFAAMFREMIFDF